MRGCTPARGGGFHTAFAEHLCVGAGCCTCIVLSCRMNEITINRIRVCCRIYIVYFYLLVSFHFRHVTMTKSTHSWPQRTRGFAANCVHTFRDFMFIWYRSTDLYYQSYDKINCLWFLKISNWVFILFIFCWIAELVKFMNEFINVLCSTKCNHFKVFERVMELNCRMPRGRL